MSRRESDRVSPKRLASKERSGPIEGYASIVSELIDLVESARRVSARSINALMTATYWEIGRRIVEFEQGGKRRAKYGEELLGKLAMDLTEIWPGIQRREPLPHAQVFSQLASGQHFTDAVCEIQ